MLPENSKFTSSQWITYHRLVRERIFEAAKRPCTTGRDTWYEKELENVTKCGERSARDYSRTQKAVQRRYHEKIVEKYFSEGNSANLIRNAFEEAIQSRQFQLNPSNGPIIKLKPENRLPKASELTLYEPGQGSDINSFDLLVELQLNLQTLRIDGVIFGFGMKKITLNPTFDGCEPEWNSKLGRDKQHNYVIPSASRFEIVGPIDPETQVLKGNPFQGEPLCRLRRLNDDEKPRVKIVISAYDWDMKVFMMRSGEAIPHEKRSILEQFVSECLELNDGTVELSSAEYVWR
jgi:hypothetical protein